MGSFDWGRLRGWAEDIGVAVEPEAVGAFEGWCREIRRWDRVAGLVGTRDEREIARLHFLDSLSVLRVAEVRGSEAVTDVGTGGGFPGLVLRVAAAVERVNLVESSESKCRYLRQMIRQMGLEGSRVFCGRAEELAHDRGLRERSPVVVTRGVGQLAVVAEYCLPLCRVGGIFVAMKGPRATEELEKGEGAVSALGGRVEMVDTFRLPEGGEERALIIIRKANRTDPAYPRKTGIPRKRPLR